jgi:hypothetical protein
MGTGALFPGVKRQVREADLHLVPKLRMVQLYLHFAICLHGTGTILLLYSTAAWDDTDMVAGVTDSVWLRDDKRPKLIWTQIIYSMWKAHNVRELCRVSSRPSGDRTSGDLSWGRQKKEREAPANRETGKKFSAVAWTLQQRKTVDAGLTSPRQESLSHFVLLGSEPESAGHEQNESAPTSTDGKRWCIYTKAVPTRNVFTASKPARMTSWSASPRIPEDRIACSDCCENCWRHSANRNWRANGGNFDDYFPDCHLCLVLQCSDTNVQGWRQTIMLTLLQWWDYIHSWSDGLLNLLFFGRLLYEAFSIETIQNVPGGKISILGGHSIGHSKQKTVHVHMSYSERFPR